MYRFVVLPLMYCLISISQLTLLIISLSLQIGSDRSFKLTEICRERGFQAFVADVLSVPLRSESFDVCICIAVIHHLSTEVCQFITCPQRYVNDIVNIRESVYYHHRGSCIMTKLVLGSTYTLLSMSPI